MKHVLVIIFAKLRMIRHEAQTIKRRSIARLFIASFLYLGFTYGAYIGSRDVTAFVLRDVHIGLFLYHRYFSIILFVFFLSVVVGNMIVAYTTLFSLKEVEFLKTHPLSDRALFTAKFIDSFFYSSSTLLMITIAALAGYSSYFGYSIWKILYLVAGLFIPYSLLAACVGVILLFIVLELTRYIPFRYLVVLVIVGYLASVIFYFRVSNPVKLAQEVMQYYPHLDSYFQNLDPPVIRWFPNFWVGESLYFLTRHDISASVMNAGLLVLVALVSTSVVIMSAGRWYHRMWMRVIELKTGRKKDPKAHRSLMSFETDSLFSRQTDVLLKRDFWRFFREPAQWLHLLVFMILMLIFMSSVGTTKIKTELPFLQTALVLGLFFFNGFLLASVALRFIFPMISLEGESIWIVRSTPLEARRIVVIKVLTVLIPMIILAILLAFVSYIPWRSRPAILALAISGEVVLSIIFTGTTLGLGSMFHLFREKSAVRIASSQGASVSFFVELFSLSVIVVILAYPINILIRTGSILPDNFIRMVIIIGCVLLIGSVSILYWGIKKAIDVLSNET